MTAHNEALAATLGLLVAFSSAIGLCLGARTKPLLNAPESSDQRERRMRINAAVLPKAKVAAILTGALFLVALIVTLSTI